MDFLLLRAIMANVGSGMDRRGIEISSSAHGSRQLLPCCGVRSPGYRLYHYSVQPSL